jgi:hypothetical protein
MQFYVITAANYQQKTRVEVFGNVAVAVEELGYTLWSLLTKPK